MCISIELEIQTEIKKVGSILVRNAILSSNYLKGWRDPVCNCF